MDITALQEFQTHYRTARDHNSKELRLTISQAERLSLSISDVGLELAKVQRELITMQSKIIELQTNPKIDWNGGTF